MYQWCHRPLLLYQYVPVRLPLAFPKNLGAVRRRVNHNVKAKTPKHIDYVVNDLNLPQPQKEALLNYYKKQADQIAMSMVVINLHNRIKELEKLAQDLDPTIRDQAEFELLEAMDQIKLDLAAADNDSDSSSSNENGPEIVEK